MLGIFTPFCPVSAQTFNEASALNLRSVCLTLPSFGGPGNIQLGSNLLQRCEENIGNTVGSIFSAVPAGVSPQSAATLSIEQRLQSVREADEDRLEGRTSARAYASNGRGASDVAQLHLPPTGGSSPDLAITLGPGLGAFVSVGAYALNHRNNRFEDGYESQLPAVTLGGDYRFADWLIAGAAFNYTYFDGTYDDAGGFTKNAFGPLLYATFLPSERTFLDVVLGYARLENSNNRLATTAFGEAPPFRGHTSADFSENQYTAGLLAGYDHPIDNFTVGPRLGFAFSHSQVGSFKEEGDTGLELRYSSLDQTSVQSSLGVRAAAAFPMSWGLLMPQASAAWVHEFANDARNVEGRLVEASPSPKFTFKREQPARDWAELGLGVSALLPNGLRPFVQFSTMQGNENFVSYGGTAGVRVGL